jgi:transposase
MLDRHSLRPEDRHPVGRSAPGAGMWLRDDLLAAAPRLAQRGSMGQAAPDPAEQAQWSRSDRLEAGFGGLLQHPGRGKRGATGPNPTDRRRSGSKHHLVVEGRGIPLNATLSGAHRHDVTQLMLLVDGIKPVRGRVGRPRRRPKRLYADRGYDSEPHRRSLRRRRIRPFIAKRRTTHGSGLGKHRWIVERTFAWLHQFRRLRVRFERRPDIHEAFLRFGCALITWRFLDSLC